MPLPHHIKLSELTQSIQRTIAGSFEGRSFWVVAETSNVKYYPAKKYYFLDLVEKDPVNDTILTSIKASAWGASVHTIANFERTTGQAFESNVAVLVKVTVEYHITYGLKVNLLDIDHSFTMGKLERQKQATLLRLVKDNPEFIQLIDGEYISYNKTLTLNPVIQRIALISSPNSDGHKDFKHELLENDYNYAFTLDEYPTQVQGAGMDAHMVNRLIEIFNTGVKYDAVVIVRGGGSQADFLMFDSYELARAVAKFPIPVFTGIGHLLNESLADIMAFRSTKTPTKVAESIISHNRSFEESILDLQKRIVSKTSQFLGENHLHLSQVAGIVNAKAIEILHENVLSLTEIKTALQLSAKERIDTSSQDLKVLMSDLNRNVIALFENEARQLNNYTKFVRHMSPESVLKRGYALVYQNGKLVTDASKIHIGSTMSTILAGTQIRSTVTDKNKIDEHTTEL